MEPHPDFADIELPRDFALGAYRLTPLSPDFVDEDLEAVLVTAPLLYGMMGGSWPKGLTREANAIDLAWHEREFTAKRSFSWIVRDGAGTYQGCFYLNPKLGERGSAKAVCWLCDIADRGAVAITLKQELTVWMDRMIPKGTKLSWVFNPEI